MLFKELMICSYQGNYCAQLEEGLFSSLENVDLSHKHFIIDSKVAHLYEKTLKPVLSSGACLLLDATEENKSLEQFPAFIEKLVAHSVRRGDTLVAIGGGIIQDITCFIAATLFRGLDWHFYPTTLLAQADSCIGSKSSINLGETKNLLGTFTPPRQVKIDPLVLNTLTEVDLRSGIGEILKIHLIDGPASFENLALNYDRLAQDSTCLLQTIYRSLEIKKRFIESDEFDRGVRNILNYGHSFGHAIEAATAFAVPHGIAVTLGMDMANFVGQRLGTTPKEVDSKLLEIHRVLKKNYAGFETTSIPFELFLNSLSKDKKNTSHDLCLILLDKNRIPTRGYYPKTEKLIEIFKSYLTEGRQ